jgi:hypothetical protein
MKKQPEKASELTKIEYFMAKAMQGLLSTDYDFPLRDDDMVRDDKGMYVCKGRPINAQTMQPIGENEYYIPTSYHQNPLRFTCVTNRYQRFARECRKYAIELLKQS